MELSFGKQVKTWLILNDMQQKDLAKMLGISNAYLSDILLGKRKGKKVREKIIKILDMKEVS
ncbi:transcriptional regulator [Bacillus amyloliquefaciens]|uniref:HTH cro/C1-type domain-containing protein n=1 Tax=Bacillus amyloliquefaciens (strain ATCC 23350 / DSM 7 / BCRC 11601 / CCUG 28519 / NBRC 15535 / NRRL B-14393 / F) TaxID=692420 RepID=A0A9P1NJ19_BACAS|nr:MULTISPECIES: helix-turn-helix transcriptional regulator [Bacillus amyloliquefaciens group]APA04080.1 transcriptional regulator [Bacillus velezensis]ASF30050.1 transcriptional regulator [Bacillus amyloliquefaciens]AZV90594.1 transcriptional regulator [Bacillus amyloliquefaciens]MDR4376493.1 helix-turn-helix transcriptional regulator [Bacillus amyloliquefaciens]MEC1841071.1 helix-turn-helix transcriptional regulator [Bacillus amyloliquefaciens]